MPVLESDKWISVSDRLPQDGCMTLYLVRYLEYGHVLYAVAWPPCDGYDWLHCLPYEVGMDVETKTVTHWMPISDPPGETG